MIQRRIKSTLRASTVRRSKGSYTPTYSSSGSYEDKIFRYQQEMHKRYVRKSHRSVSEIHKSILPGKTSTVFGKCDPSQRCHLPYIICSVTPIKMRVKFSFLNLDKLILNCIYVFKMKAPRNSQNNPKERQSGRYYTYQTLKHTRKPL